MWILFVVQYYIFGLVRFKDISILNQLDMLRSITPNLSADIRRMEFCVLSFQQHLQSSCHLATVEGLFKSNLVYREAMQWIPGEGSCLQA